MKRRQFLLGAGSATLGGSALLGSGAFSRVESQRDITIQVAEDPDAYLGLDGCDTLHGDNYVSPDEKGHLEVDIGENPNGGEGVNSNSRTWFDNVFEITNQGKESACIWIERPDDWPEADDGDPRVDFYVGGDRDRSILGNQNPFGLDIGQSTCIGIKTLTKGVNATETDDLLEGIDAVTIIADVDAECLPIEEVPIEQEPIEEEIRLAYQWREGSDFDYNDFVVDVGIRIDSENYEAEDDGLSVEALTLEFTPRAASLGVDGAFEFELAEDNGGFFPNGCEGDWELFRGEPGALASVDNGEFNGVNDPVEVFADTKDVFDEDDQGGNNIVEPCADPKTVARLEIEFDEGCEFGADAFELETLLGDPEEPHGENLFFDPESGSKEDDPAGRGDIELLVTTTDWPVPKEKESIWDAYDDVKKDDEGGFGYDEVPDFPEGPDWRIEQNVNENLVVDVDGGCGGLNLDFSTDS